MWEVSDTESFYQRVKELSVESIYLHLEHASYECGGRTITQKQFIVQDPHGYLFRFCDELRELDNT